MDPELDADWETSLDSFCEDPRHIEVMEAGRLSDRYDFLNMFNCTLDSSLIRYEIDDLIRES